MTIDVDTRDEDLRRVMADPQKAIDELGIKKFVAMYPELADKVEMVAKPIDILNGTDARLVGRLDEQGSQMIGNLIQGPFDEGQALIDAEKPANEQPAVAVDERTAALESVIHSTAEKERMQIVSVLYNYARDCQERGDELEKSGDRERKRLRKTGHVTEAESARKMQRARAGAFKVRAAVAADLAYKAQTCWGRNPDGSPQDEINADAPDVAEAPPAIKRA